METLVVAPQRHVANMERIAFIKQPIAVVFSGQEIPLQIAPFLVDPGLHLIRNFLGSRQSTCQAPSRSSQRSFRRRRFMFPILCSGAAPSPTQNCHYPWGNQTPMVTRAHPGPRSKRHLGRSSRLYRIPFVTDTHTDRQTDIQTHASTRQ